MDSLKDIFTKKETVLHHAYVIEGDKERVRSLLAHTFKESRTDGHVVHNADYSEREVSTFGIDEAKELRERQSRSAVGLRRVFVICAERFTHEAQNALLKTLEEPAAGTHFFFVVPSVAGILPTVRSRVVCVREDAPHATDTQAREFLAASYGERAAHIAEMIEGKNREHARAFLSGLAEVLRARYRSSGATDAYGSSLRAIERCRRHLGGRAPSLKMLLEYVSLVLPRC